MKAQTKRNDLNAVSSFCSWLLEQGKIDHHPLKGLRRPKVIRARPEIFTPEECGRLLSAVVVYSKGKWLGTIAVLLFTGARPSELEDTRLFYGRHPVARLEGGKLRGRANRIVPLLPVAGAWLRAARLLRSCAPPATIRPRESIVVDRVRPLTRVAREKLCELASITWKHDICRHTFISHRLEMLKKDGAVAREAGTSEDVIFRHYHRLPVAGALRPVAGLAPVQGCRTSEGRGCTQCERRRRKATTLGSAIGRTAERGGVASFTQGYGQQQIRIASSIRFLIVHVTKQIIIVHILT